MGDGEKCHRISEERRWELGWASKAGQDLKKKGRRGQSKQGENMLKSSKVRTAIDIWARNNQPGL